MYWDHQYWALGLLLPGQPCILCPLVQDTETLSMGISRMKVIPQCHIPCGSSPAFCSRAIVEGQCPAPLGPHMVPQVLPPPVTQSVLPGDYWMRMVSRAALLPSWLSFPSTPDLDENLCNHAICAGAHKSLKDSLLAWLSPRGPHSHSPGSPSVGLLGLCAGLTTECLPHPGQSPGVTPNSPPGTTLGGRSGSGATSQGLSGALQALWKCWWCQPTARTPTRA